MIDSRTSDGGRAIRRRRVCTACDRRFTTYERYEAANRLMVIKRDGTRQTFDAQRILQSIEAACAKRPIDAEAKHRIVEEVEEQLHREFDREVPSRAIGDAVMLRLRQIDQVAYVRFASVYKKFRDLDDLIEEVKETKIRADAEVPGQGELFSPGTPNTSTI